MLTSMVIGVDLVGMMKDMPLVIELNFQEGTWPVPPEEIVDDLLARAHGLRQ